MDRVRARVFVSGMVQGVNFRWTARHKAEILGISGWVRNLGDGRVEACFEGDKGAVGEMIDWCHRGPAGASISSVEIKREKYQNEFDGFSVIR